MSDGLYSAMSGAMATSKQLDIVANNLANVDTTGFKKEKTVFGSQQPSVTFDLLELQAPETEMPPKILPLDKQNVVIGESYTDLTQGQLQQTGNPLDVALQGEGFFKIKTPNGMRYTRDGTFAISHNQQLVTQDGYPVLDDLNQPIELNQGAVTINSNGEVYQSGQRIATLGTIQFPKGTPLLKEGKNLWQGDPNKEQSASPIVHQGFLESANVNPVEEMVQLIQLHRSFELNSRVIETFGELNRKAATDVGRIG